jgi:hypothetical protein
VKILYHHRVASKDGQYVHIEELIRALRERGHEVILVAPPLADKQRFGSEGGIVPYLKQYIPGAIYELLEFFYSFVAYRKLAAAIRKYRPDCIYERYSLYMPAGIWAKRHFRLPLLLEVNAVERTLCLAGRRRRTAGDRSISPAYG